METAVLQQSISTSPDGLTTRGAALEDVDNAMKLFKCWSKTVAQKDELTKWVSPGFNLTGKSVYNPFSLIV